MLREAADRHGALFAVNDRADIALAAEADVLHLGQDDLPMAWARHILGDDVLLGRSTHDPDQAARAAAEPWDYLVAGPVWATATKPGRPPPAPPSSRPSPPSTLPNPGSPSAASTPPTSPRSPRPAPPGS